MGGGCSSKDCPNCGGKHTFLFTFNSFGWFGSGECNQCGYSEDSHVHPVCLKCKIVFDVDDVRVQDGVFYVNRMPPLKPCPVCRGKLGDGWIDLERPDRDNSKWKVVSVDGEDGAGWRLSESLKRDKLFTIPLELLKPIAKVDPKTGRVVSISKKYKKGNTT